MTKAKEIAEAKVKEEAIKTKSALAVKAKKDADKKRKLWKKKIAG